MIISLVALLGIFYITSISISKILFKENISHLKDISNNIIYTLDRVLYEKMINIKAIASNPILTSENSTKNQIEKTLINYRNTYKTYISLSYFNSDRTRIADTSGLNIGMKDIDHSFWKLIMQRKSSFGLVQESITLKKPVIFFATPVVNKNNILLGAVVGRVSILRLNELIGKVCDFSSFAPNLKVDLFNKDGLLIYSNYNTKDILKKKYDVLEAGVDKYFSEEKKNGVIKEHGHNGSEFIAVYNREKGYFDFKGNDWLLVIHYPTSIIYKPLSNLMNKWILMVIPTVIFSILLMIYLTKKLSLPISMLVRSVNDLGKGNFDIRATSSSNDEVGILSKAFNLMAANLKIYTDSQKKIAAELAAGEKAKKLSAEWDETFNSITDFIFILNANHEILKANKAFCEFIKIKADDLIGRKCYEVMHKLNVSCPGCPADKTIMDKKEHFKEINEPYLDIPLLVSTFPIINNEGVITRIVHIAKDISERKEAEKKLLDMAKFPEEDTNPVFRISYDFKLLYRNTASQKLFFENEKIGSYLLRRKWKPVMNRVLASGAKESIELKIDDRIYLFHIIPITKAKYINIYGVDITDRKAVEEQLFQIQKMDAIGTLASGVAHDFNNFLANIQGYANLFLSEYEGKDNSIKYIEEIVKQTDIAANIVKQILNVSKLSESKTELLSIGKIVSNIDIILNLARNKSISVSLINNTPKDMFISVNLIKVQQLMLNLINNAINAMDNSTRKKLVVTLDTEFLDKTKASVLSLSKGSYLKIFVKDTGNGIAPELKTKIFNPFFTTGQNGKSTGLGLSVIHKIVKSHNGFITFESDIGVGTEFKVYLPLSMNINKKHDVQLEHPKRDRITILVVDDEKELLTIYEKILNKHGFKVYTVSDGEDALKFFDKNKDIINIVITDQVMPKVSGSELCRQILEIKPDIPVILISGFSNMSLKEAESLGFVDMFSKPVNFKTLIKVIEKYS